MLLLALQMRRKISSFLLRHEMFSSWRSKMALDATCRNNASRFTATRGERSVPPGMIHAKIFYAGGEIQKGVGGHGKGGIYVHKLSSCSGLGATAGSRECIVSSPCSLCFFFSSPCNCVYAIILLVADHVNERSRQFPHGRHSIRSFNTQRVVCLMRKASRI